MGLLYVLVRRYLDPALTFEQMAACCQNNWALRRNFQSRNENENSIMQGDHIKIHDKSKTQRKIQKRKEKKCPSSEFETLKMW